MQLRISSRNEESSGKIKRIQIFCHSVPVSGPTESDGSSVADFFHVINVRSSDWIKNECKQGPKNSPKQSQFFFFALRKERSCSYSCLPELNFQAFVVWLDTVMANAVNGGSHSSIESLNGELHKQTKPRFSRVNL